MVKIVTKGNDKDDRAGLKSVYKSDTNTILVSAVAKAKNGAKEISGTVTDGKKVLPGVNILIQDADKGTVTDFDGKFSIEAKKGDVITFKYTGLPTTTLTVTDQNKYHIKAIKITGPE